MAYWVPSYGEKPEGDRPNLYPEEVLTTETRQYQGVFLLDRLPYKKDYARVEDDEQAGRIHDLIGGMYRSIGYNPIRVPVMPIDERAEFVIEQMIAIDPNVPYLPLLRLF